MGNVLASSKPITASTGTSSLPPLGLPTDPTLSSSTDNNVQQSTTALALDTELENPGTLEDLHKKCKDVMPTNFEGAKLMLQKGLSNHFHVSHTLSLCQANSGYRFAATYVGTKQLSPTEAFPLLLGDIDPAGNLNANVIHQVTPNIRCKIASQIQNSKITAAQLTADLKGLDYTASLTLGNINVLNNSGVLVGHYLQSVTKKLALGAELAYQYGQQVPGGEIAIMSAAGKYVNGQATWSGTLGLAGAHICYYRKASEQLQIGIELETSLRMQEAIGTIGYQVDLPKADLVFRGMIDTNWNVGAVMEKKLQPLPFTFALSGLLNHQKTQFKLGVGMIIG